MSKLKWDGIKSTLRFSKSSHQVLPSSNDYPAEIAVLKQRIRSLELSARAVEKDNQSLQKRLEDLYVDRQVDQEKLAVVTIENSDREKQGYRDKQVLDNLSNEFDYAKREIRSLRRHLEALNQERETDQECLAVATRENLRIEKQNSQCRESLDALKSKIRSMEKKSHRDDQKAQKEALQYRQHREECAVKISTSEESISQLGEELEKQKELHASTTIKLNTVQNELDQEKRKTTHLIKEVAIKTDQLAFAQQECIAMHEEQDDINKLYTTLENHANLNYGRLTIMRNVMEEQVCLIDKDIAATRESFAELAKQRALRERRYESNPVGEASEEQEVPAIPDSQ